MKKIILILNIAILIISCNAVSEPSEKQVQFAKQISDMPGVLNTEWATALILKVTVHLDALGANPKMQSQLLADKIAADGLEYTEKAICVKIYYGNLNKLADSCLYE